jgi:hypothetical protein
MNQEEFERLPAGGVGVGEALARLKRENPDAYAAHVSIMHRRPRGGLAVQEYSPERGTLAHAAWTATQVMHNQAEENDALWHLLPPDCDRLAWWECFQACLRSARYVAVVKERAIQAGAPRPSS